MRTVDLWAYLPAFLQRFPELREILRAEEPEFQTLVRECERLLDDGFIATATTRGLERFERVMNLRPERRAALETRRQTVQSRWYNDVPYTLRVLKRRLGMLQGSDRVKVWFTEDEPHRIHIQTSLEEAALWPELKALLAEMLPANLALALLNLIEIESVPAPAGTATLAGCVARSERANMALLQLRNVGQTLPAAGNRLTGVYALTGRASTVMAGGRGRSAPVAVYHATRAYAATAAMTTAMAKP